MYLNIFCTYVIISFFNTKQRHLLFDTTNTIPDFNLNYLILCGSRGSESVLLPGSGQRRGLNVAVSGDWAGGAPAQARDLVTRLRGVRQGEYEGGK